ncbi:MAG: type I restriction-modification enzyme R subunit C-terminal domain-containing protein [Opitutaceae bacterium]
MFNIEPLTATDLAELERIFIETGVGTLDDLEKAKVESQGLGLFVRSLVGLDRQAAKQAFAAFVSRSNLRANQIQFLDEIINHLTEHGCLSPERLYASPYTDISARGVDGVFDAAEVDTLISILEEVRTRATADSA